MTRGTRAATQTSHLVEVRAASTGSSNGADVYVGTLVAELSTIPLLRIITIVAVLALTLTKLISSIATTAALAPVVAGPPWCSV